MGGLLAYKVGNYNETVKQAQFHFLCGKLNAHYGNTSELCVFVGNYNVGCKVDALFIKRDAIISIYFKNYGGQIIAQDNGEWTCNGKMINDNSSKTVLQQARINRSMVKKGLKALGIPNQSTQNLPTLFIFNQPIEISNNLCSTNKSWLYITDNNHFIEKLDEIVCSHINLNHQGITYLTELLNLNSTFLTAYSNAACDKQSNTRNIHSCEEIKEHELPKTSVNSNNNDSCTSDYAFHLNSFFKNRQIGNKDKNRTAHLYTKEELADLRNYAMQIITTVWDKPDVVINAMNHKDFLAIFNEFTPLIRQENIIIIEGDYNENEKNHLQKFLGKELVNISDYALFWQTGNDIDSNIYKSLNQGLKTICDHNTNDSVISFILPKWIDDAIFNNLGAKYSPDHIRYEYNLDLNKEEVLTYLGTYFPRSFSEVYILFEDLLLNSNYKEIIRSKKNINILDFGCGTGGDIIGLLSIIDKHLLSVESVQIFAIDGNQEALRIFERILGLFKEKSRLIVKETIAPVFIEEGRDFNIISQLIPDNFDLIISCKAICEMLAKGKINTKAYKRTADLLSKKLSLEGILLIEDVTIKIPTINEFIPILLNTELNEFVRENPKFVTLAPVPCKKHGHICKKGCFMKKEISISHSHKKDDISKIVYRLIGYKDFSNNINYYSKY